ncbi:MAG: hypothetical protein ABIG34_02530 [Candidatus Peregrinibacteria bacterium]
MAFILKRGLEIVPPNIETIIKDALATDLTTGDSKKSDRFGQVLASCSHEEFRHLYRRIGEEVEDDRKRARTEGIGHRVSRKARELLGTVIPAVAPGPSREKNAEILLWMTGLEANRRRGSVADDKYNHPEKGATETSSRFQNKDRQRRQLVQEGIMTWGESLTISFTSEGPSRVVGPNPEFPEIWTSLEISVDDSDKVTKQFILDHAEELHAMYKEWQKNGTSL